MRAAELGGSVEVSGTVKGQGSYGCASVTAAFEVVESLLSPGSTAGTQFEDCAVVGGSAFAADSVEVSRGIEDQAEHRRYAFFGLHVVNDGLRLGCHGEGESQTGSRDRSCNFCSGICTMHRGLLYSPAWDVM